MGDFLTVAGLKIAFDASRIEQLATEFDTTRGQSVYNSAIVESIILQAEGLILNELSQYYSAAELQADQGIIRSVADVALYYLEARRPGEISYTVEQNFKLVLGMIERLKSNTSKLAATEQRLPSGDIEEPTEATDSGYFD